MARVMASVPRLEIIMSPPHTVRSVCLVLDDLPFGPDGRSSDFVIGTARDTPTCSTSGNETGGRLRDTARPLVADRSDRQTRDAFRLGARASR